MNNYCQGCHYGPDRRSGPHARPFSVLYWDFPLRHRERFLGHPRMSLQMRNAERMWPAAADAIRSSTRQVRDRYRS